MPRTIWVTLGQSFSLADPQTPHLDNPLGPTTGGRRASQGHCGDRGERLAFPNSITRTHKAMAAVLIQAEKPGRTPRPIMSGPVRTSPLAQSSSRALSPLAGHYHGFRSILCPARKSCFLRWRCPESHFIRPPFLFLMLMRSRYRVVAFIFLRKYIASFLCKWHMCLELFGDQY